MSEEDIIRFCSPTLAGIKPGNLFTATYDDSEQLQKELDVLANRLSAKGVKILSLRQKQGRALLYFYRPCLLKECLRHLGARLLLQQRGYPPDQPQRCLKNYGSICKPKAISLTKSAYFWATLRKMCKASLNRKPAIVSVPVTGRFMAIKKSGTNL